MSIYDPTIPNPSESPKDSAPEIQSNFEAYAAIFSRTVGGVVYNHIAFNDSHQGKHAVVMFENQTADPGVTLDQTILYNKDASSAASTEPQLFAQIPQFLPTDVDTNTAPNIGMQLTYQQVNTAGPQYQSFLVGGYLIYFGTQAFLAGNTTVTLSPTPTEILNVQISFAQPVVTQPDKFTISLILPLTLSYMVIAKA